MEKKPTLSYKISKWAFLIGSPLALYFAVIDFNALSVFAFLFFTGMAAFLWFSKAIDERILR